MTKINNTKITYGMVYGLIILVVLAFGVIIIPALASAQYYGGTAVNYQNYPTYNNGQPLQNQNNYNVIQNTYTDQSDSSYVPPTVYSNSTVVNKTSAPTKTAAKKSDTASSLAANAIFGSKSFMPSGLIQWVLFAIFILLIIILIRKTSGAEEKFHAEPLKHA